MSGVGAIPDDLAEVMYRERFGLSSRQMDDEPADAVEYWLAVEAERRKQEKRQR